MAGQATGADCPAYNFRWLGVYGYMWGLDAAIGGINLLRINKVLIKLNKFGSVPKRSTGADCKSAGSRLR